MSLGVSGATCFSSNNNHKTALNHAVRDESSKDVKKCAEKTKCTGCGIWAAAGSTCKICKTELPKPKVKPNWNQKVEPLSVVKAKKEAASTTGGDEVKK